LKIGIPIPLWKVNKGNVEKAKYAIQQNEKNSEYQKLNLETQVESAYQTWKNHYDQYFELNRLIWKIWKRFTTVFLKISEAAMSV
jgi:cobalt-zinc-cadmium efflux system outer membrane protein